MEHSEGRTEASRELSGKASPSKQLLKGEAKAAAVEGKETERFQRAFRQGL